MSTAEILLAPELTPAREKTKWEREYEAFLAMFPDLFPQYEEQYVAVHEGRIVASGTDEVEVAMAAYREVGYQPIHVGKVSRKPLPIARIPSPRRISNLAILESD